MKNLKAIKYNGGIIRPTAYKTFQAEVNYRGQRLRQTFKRLEHARDWITNTLVDAECGHRPLSAAELEQARDAFTALPAGTTLPEVVRFWISRHSAVRESLSLQEAIDRYIDAKTRRGLRPESIRTPRARLNRLAGALKGTLVHNVTMADLLACLESWGVSGQTLNGYRADWAAFFQWCLERQYCAENPGARLEPHQIRGGLPEFLPAPLIASFLGELERHDPALIPFYSLNFFLGIRDAELRRMDGDMVGPDLVRVTPEHAKTGAMRLLEPHETARQWIEAYPPRGPLVQTNHRYRAIAIRDRLGKPHWPQNGGRHAAATYCLAWWEDAARVAYMLGHRNTDLLYTTYRGLATKDEAKAYMAIRPGEHNAG